MKKRMLLFLTFIYTFLLVSILGDRTVLAYERGNGYKVIAHRGYSSVAPENTIPAYELAAGYGFYGAETDICETRDNHYILMHDNSVDRTTDGTGLVIQLTLDEIRNLKVDAGANIEKYKDLRVPTLEEYLAVCKSTGIIPVIEVKEITNPKHLVDIIRRHEMDKRCIIISFNRQLLEEIRRIDKKINIQAIIDITSDNIKYCKKNKFDIDTSYSLVTKELVDEAHKYGVQVNTWTVNDSESINNMIKYGVDFITSDVFIKN